MVDLKGIACPLLLVTIRTAKAVPGRRSKAWRLYRLMSCTCANQEPADKAVGRSDGLAL